jgi:hypothetical protein
MFRLRFATIAGTALTLATTTLGAQGLRTGISQSELPPAGLCRVWLDGVPANRQPRPTDCATARRNAPANSRIIYGNQSQGRVGLDPRVGTVNGRYDPRADPRSPSYDPRYDPNSRLYDPRYGTNGNNGRYDSRYSEKEREKLQREREREREKLQRQREKELREREKAARKNDKRWEKERKHDH